MSRPLFYETHYGQRVTEHDMIAKGFFPEISRPPASLKGRYYIRVAGFIETLHYTLQTRVVGMSGLLYLPYGWRVAVWWPNMQSERAAQTGRPDYPIAELHKLEDALGPSLSNLIRSPDFRIFIVGDSVVSEVGRASAAGSHAALIPVFEIDFSVRPQ